MLRSDLPLDRETGGFFLPAIIGFMIFLAALALGGSMGLDNLLSRWRSQIEASFTVELPPVEGEDAKAAGARRQAALDAIAGLPGIAGTHLLDEAEKSRLLAPWLGGDIAGLDLPLPDLIAVTTAPGAAIDMPALGARLQALSPGAAIDDHGRWRRAIAAISRTARLAAFSLLALVGAAAALTVVFVSRAGLAAHRRVIEILHLVGAHDGYIAGQFQRHALLRGLVGGALGTAAAAAVLEAAGRLLPGLEGTGFALAGADWAALALLPIAGALLAMATARYTVLRALRKMM